MCFLPCFSRPCRTDCFFNTELAAYALFLVHVRLSFFHRICFDAHNKPGQDGVYENMRICLRLAVLLSALMLSNLWHITAQSDALLSQYFYAPIYYNAGATGNAHVFNITAAGQFHNGSDKCAHVSADMPFSLGGTHRIGGGITAGYANTTILRTLNFSVPLAWKFSLGNSEISLGVAPGIMSSTIRSSGTVSGDELQTPAEESTKISSRHKTRFNLGGGVWYNSQSFRAGLSFTNLGNKRLIDKADNRNHTGITAYYFMASGNIPIKSSLLDIEPSAIAMLSSGKINGQATARAIWKRCLWIGAGYRLHESAILMAGIEIKGFKAGYSYLLQHHSKGHNSKAGHEVVAGYSIPLELSDNKKPRHKSVRLM